MSAPLMMPDLDRLDDAASVHDAIVGAAGVLAERLSQLGTGTDAVHAAYAIGHLAKHAQTLVSEVHSALLAARP